MFFTTFWNFQLFLSVLRPLVDYFDYYFSFFRHKNLLHILLCGGAILLYSMCFHSIKKEKCPQNASLFYLTFSIFFTKNVSHTRRSPNTRPVIFIVFPFLFYIFFIQIQMFKQAFRSFLLGASHSNVPFE